MSKTAQIPDDIHALIVDKQTELKRKHKITVKIPDLIAMHVRYGIEKTEKLLGLKSDEESDIINDVRQDMQQGIVDDPEKLKVIIENDTKVEEEGIKS